MKSGSGGLWVRLYASTIQTQKVQSLPLDVFKTWVNCLCIAKGYDGFLPAMDVVAFDLHTSKAIAQRQIDVLVSRDLIDCIDGTYRMHDWDEWQYESDSSKERMRRSRAKRSSATVTPKNVTSDGNVTSQVTPCDSHGDALRDRDRNRDRIIHTAASFSDYGCDDLVEELYATWPQIRRGGKPVISELVIRKVGESVDPQVTIQTIRQAAKGYLSRVTEDTFCLALKKWLEEDEWTNPIAPAYSGPDPRMIL